MGFRKVVTVALAVTLAALAGCAALADATAEAGRKTAAKWGDAVVTLQLVIKTSMSYEGESDKRESKVEATGVVIDPTGLTVTSLSATSPEDAFSGMYDEEDGISITTEVTDVKVLLGDGTELPARVVLRDKDLDLAFVRLKEKPAKPLAYLDLSKTAKPTILDEMVILHRMGTVASRVLAACTDRVQAVVEKPRRFYIPGMLSMGVSLGAPAFAVDGDPIGILLLRTSTTSSDDMSYFSGISSMGMTYIILPATDISEVAKQAGEDEGSAERS